MGIFWPGRSSGSRGPGEVATVRLDYSPEEITDTWRAIPDMHAVFAAGAAQRRGLDIETARGLGEVAAEEAWQWLASEKGIYPEIKEL